MHRVLVISHDLANRALLSDALDRTFQVDHLDGARINLRGIIDAIVKQPIDLVVLDSDLGDLSGTSVLEAIQLDPVTREVPVVMLTCSQMESQEAVAINMGAADCLAMPCSAMLIQARVRRACRQPRGPTCQPGENGRLIAFVGAKGGVGTTTVTVNTGVSLVEKGFQVTAVDLHGFYGTMASQLGVYPHDHPHNFAELLDEPVEEITHESIERLLLHHSTGMKVLLGAQEGDGYHHVTSEQAEALIWSLSGHANYTLFDLPPWPTHAVETVLNNCDQVLLVLERETAALQAANTLLSTLVSDGVMRGDVAAVIVNRAIVSTPIPIDYFRKNLGCPIAAMIPPAPDACAAAAMSREPLIQFRHDADCAEALEALAGKLTEDHISALAF